MSKGQRVGYVRVSSTDQNLARQLEGIEVDRTFEEKASAKDAQRPVLKQALAYVREGDTLVVHSMDRLARNLMDLRKIVEDLTARGVVVQFVKESLTFTGENNAMATLMLNIMGAVAEFERSIIRERQREGIALARAKGTYSKERSKKLRPEEVAEVREQAASGVPKADIARAYGISRQTLYTYLGGGSPVVR